jgi:hypothetical protein
VSVELAGSEQAPTAEGFLRARLTVADPNGQLGGVVRAVSCRPKRGGPTLLHAASIPPRTHQVLEVLLPAVSAQETFVVRLLSAEGQGAAALREAEVPVTFANLDAVDSARGALVDSAAYEDWLEELPRWPPWLLRGVVLTAVLVCLALGGVLLVRPAIPRVLAVAAVAAAGTFATWRAASDCETVLARRVGDLTVVTCRRTAPWSCPAEGIGPVYGSQSQMDRDDMVYRPGRSLTVTLRPADVRIFRRRGVRAPSTATRPQSSPAS